MSNPKITCLLLILILLTTSLSAVDHIASTIKIKGNVNLTRNENVYPAQLGDVLFNGDILESGTNSFAAVQFIDNKSIIKLFPNSILHIDAEKKGDRLNKKCKLDMGEIWAKISKKQGDFEIETATTVVSVKGTEFLVTFMEDGTTDVYTMEGQVFIRNKIDDLIATAETGQHAQTTGSGTILVEEFDASEIPLEINEFMEETIDPPKIEEQNIRPDEDDLPPPGTITPEEHNLPEPKETGSYSPSSSREGFSMGGSAGTALLNGQVYTRVRFMPELVIGKFGIGLDIDLLIDGEGQIRKEDWDDFGDYLAKILYLRYGHRGDPFFGKIGGFTNYSLGHGLVMKDYTNMLYHPDFKQVGLQLGGNIPAANMTLEGFSSDIFKNEILAGRLTFQPLLETELTLMNRIIFGTTIAHDRNQYKGLKDSDDDEYADIFDDYPYNDNWHNQVDHDIDDYRAIFFELNPNSNEDEFIEWFYNSDVLNSLRNPSFDEFGTDEVTVYALDYELPLVESNLFYLSHYGEFAQIVEHNNGFIFPGFFTRFLIFQMNLEFRHYQEDFTPSFFDYLYEAERATAIVESDTSYSITTKEMLVPLSPELSGWYASVTTNIFNFLYLTVSYEDMYGKDDYRNKSIWGKMRLEQRIIPNLAVAEVEYGQNNFDKLEAFKAPSAYVDGRLGYMLGPSTQLVGSYRERYVDLNNNGKIKGEDETIKTMSFGVEFRF
ncbi:FecR domain-containing protein [Candidatus Cloacimonadota bacterium]